MKIGNMSMLHDMTGRVLYKVLYARVEFQKSYADALVIRFLRNMERWNKLSCHCLSPLRCRRKLPERQLASYFEVSGALFSIFVYCEVALMRVAVVFQEA
jgi:hypothetical protein